MAVLSSKQVLQESNTSNSDSITSLALTAKALSDVSCLDAFKNIQRLDLSFNSLTSIDGLRSCVNLKWLSVAQNKLQSLEGIECLVKLTVLNAAKNKLKSVDGLNSLVNLRALILNDNEISSICKLDQMKDLNTVVLSRNPIRELGLSLAKRNSISKLSLSNCQLQLIGSSLKSCTELKELRLSHNEITTLPSELACNNKLQNLDLGNNAILRWPDLKVLSSLINLKNLNLHGNPIAEKDGLVKKIQKLVPNMVVFNAKPISKILKGESGRANTSHDVDIVQNVGTKGLPRTNSRKHSSQSENVGDCDVKESKPKKQKRESKNENKKNEIIEEASDHDLDQLENRKIINNDSVIGTRKTSKPKTIAFDDGETPFMNLFTDDASANSFGSDNPGVGQSVDETVGSVTHTKKKRQNKKQSNMLTSVQLLTAVDEVGLGGPSMWD
ncbi:unnamed protein product [Cuscuta europaea]|uniref:Uncharacterized protein n=2 Tax=Cuscuta europaea TaxID=41803 RepID=A0A9P0YRD0_CUSEU|nr:unnamed protein product [Cuscuta europaea]